MAQTRPMGLPCRTAEKRPGVVPEGSMGRHIYIYGSLMECLGGAVGLWIYDSHVGMFMTSKQCGWSCGWFYVGVVYRG